jgi:hypothetical protein
MPRQPRLEYPGAVYHVVNRGDRREEIFRDARRGRTTISSVDATTWLVVALVPWALGLERISGGFFCL